MTPQVAVDIFDRDKTGPGRKSAEKGFAGFAKRTQEQAEKSGFAKLGKHLDALRGGSKMTLAFDGLGHTLSSVAKLSGRVSGGVATATQRMLNFGSAGEGAMEGVVTGGAAAVGTIAGIGAALVAAGVAVDLFGAKWADLGAKADRTAKDIGVSVEQVQSLEGAGERVGIDAGSADQALGTLGNNLFQSRYGKRNDILAANNQLGLQTKTDKNGNPDTKGFLYDLADVIARQKTPQAQREIAELYGVTALLPLLRQGSAGMKAQEADFNTTGRGFTADEAERSTRANKQHVAMLQRASAAEKGAGMLAMYGTEAEDKAAIGGMTGVKGFIEHPLTSLRTTLGPQTGAQQHARLEHVVSRLEGQGWTRDQAIGLAANFTAESNLNEGAWGDSFAAYGIGQWHADRQAAFKKRFGHDIHQSTLDEQIDFATYELTRGSEQKAGEAIMGARTKGEAAAVASRTYERPLDEDGEAIKRARLADRLAVTLPTDDRNPAQTADATDAGAAPTQVAQAAAPAKAHVEITLKGAPAGTVAKTTGGQGVTVNTNIVRSLDHAG